MSNLIDLNGTPMMSSLLYLSFKGSVIIGLVLALQFVAGKRFSAQMRYCLWVPALFCLVLPFGVEASWSPFKIFSPAQAPIQTISTTIATTQKPETFQFGYASFWALCVLALLSVVVYNFVRYARMGSRAHITDEKTQTLLARCKKELSISRSVRVLEAPDVLTPLVYGLRHPTILLPEGLSESLDNDELHYVLLHELAHVKRNDIAVNWLMTVVQILHWFNPLVWYGFHRMRRDREMACDARVLQHLHPREHRAYGHALIALMDRYPQALRFSHGLGIVGNTKRMKERLHMIKQFKTFRTRDIVAGGAALVLVAVLAFSENRISAHEPTLHTEAADSDEIEKRLMELRERIEAMEGNALQEHMLEVQEHGTEAQQNEIRESIQFLREHGSDDERELLIQLDEDAKHLKHELKKLHSETKSHDANSIERYLRVMIKEAKSKLSQLHNKSAVMHDKVEMKRALEDVKEAQSLHTKSTMDVKEMLARAKVAEQDALIALEHAMRTKAEAEKKLDELELRMRHEKELELKKEMKALHSN